MSKTRQAFLHIVIWLVLLLFFVFIGSRNSSFHDAIIIFVYFGIFNVALFYANYLYILPHFLNSRKYVLCSLVIVILILLSGLAKYGLASIFKDTILLQQNSKTAIGFWEYYLASILTSTFFVFISTAFKFGADWFLNEKVKRNLESEKLAAELAFLKSQINPHFLFNSLNNIYSLAYQRSDKTPEAILKLSEMMRYMLHESNELSVDLSKELRYLDNYIALQKLRLKNIAFVDLSIRGDATGHRIAPLILIAFVENAFKHGLACDSKHPITISIIIGKDHLKFVVCNRKSLMNKDEASGIGLINVKRRLDLLYSGKYNLEIKNDEFTYSTELSLDLTL